MTIVNGIEIDHIEFFPNKMKDAIEQNDPIDDKLHVIAVISNPCMFAKRYILMKEFMHRMKNENNVELYIVELAYKDQPFIITTKNPKHLQIRTDTPLWHKENMINLGVKLLPKNYKAFAWIDADLEFESSTWALDTLKILNGCCDIVQLFSHAVDMDQHKMTMRVFNSSGYMYQKGKKYINNGNDQWHPGYAWAITRKAYEKIGGLYDKAILGSGDNIMMLSILGNGLKAISSLSCEEYKETVLSFQEKISRLRFGYTPGVIRHHFHGSKKNRKYQERWVVLVNHNYSPSVVKYDKNGVIVPTEQFSEEFKDDIMNYFQERNEDEFLHP